MTINRMKKGFAAYNTRFQPRDIINIRRYYDSGERTAGELADLYQCGVETIRKIGRRETFRHITEAGVELEERYTAETEERQRHEADEMAQRLFKVAQEVENGPGPKPDPISVVMGELTIDEYNEKLAAWKAAGGRD